MIRIGLLIIVFAAISCLQAQTEEWKYYGGDQGGQRMVNLKQISRDNVDALSIAWTFRTSELETYQGNDYLLERAAFEATPLMIDGTLFFPTPSNRVFALDATTGEQKWVFDPQLDFDNLDLSEMTCRGVSYWEKGGEQRLLMGTIDGRIFCIDARTGILDSNFNDNGFVDLKLGAGLVQMTSAPAIFEDLVIAGTSVGDNNRTHAARGVVRAYHIESGKKIWQFDPIPDHPDDPAQDQWLENSAFRTGAANVWATISVDVENEMVYLPTSSPSPDYYGGERLGNNDYANSIVALDGKSGKYRWHFQVVHHDLWDYDIPCQPVLFDLQRDSGSIPAVAVGTKMGHIFILNRLNGKPIFPVEERAVSASTIPGEVASPTQPFPLTPKPLGLQKLQDEDIWGPTEALRKEAQIAFRHYRYEGIFTPPSLAGTIVAPGNIGGIHWGGLSIDYERNLLITNINRLAYLVTLHPREKGKSFSKFVAEKQIDDNLVNPETNRMIGTPYYMSRSPYLKAREDGVVWQYTKPPWGTILAIDLKTGDKIWEKPLGYIGDLVKNPENKHYGSVNKGGTFVTASGLTFVSGTVDNFIRAFATETGELLWEHSLPASGIATPMSYQINGRQFVVIAAGGHGKNRFTTMGDYVVAFALPD